MKKFLKYLLEIYDYKLKQSTDFIFQFINRPISNLILGANIYNFSSCEKIYITAQDICHLLKQKGIGGDFSILNILSQIGLLGTVTFVLMFILLKNNNLNYINYTF